MKVVIFTALFIAPLLAGAQGGNFQTGNKLKSYCAGSDLASLSFCTGYVIGVADNNSFYICAPGGSGGVTQGQFRDVVKKYLDDNPAQLHRDADALVLTALKQAFPCPKK